MPEITVAAVSAIWLGILTSISPCPLATNVAAVSFIGNRFQKPSSVLLTGLIYTAGRAAAYLILGVLIVSSMLSMPILARFLQDYMNKLLGPVLIVTGLFLLEFFRLTLPGWDLAARIQSQARNWGIWGAFPLGIVFALSFCPVSAALFFGSLIPIALKTDSGILIPSVYGIGTALPVFLFALVIAFGANRLSRIFNRITQFEKWTRRITGILFIGVGVYFTLMYIFNVF